VPKCAPKTCTGNIQGAPPAKSSGNSSPYEFGDTGASCR
jgi:hypothetical protein